MPKTATPRPQGQCPASKYFHLDNIKVSLQTLFQQQVRDLSCKELICFWLWSFIINLFDKWRGFLTTSEIDQDSFDIWWKLMFSSYYQSKLCHFHTFNWDLLLTKLIMISWELRHNHNQKVSNLGDMKHEVPWHDEWSTRAKVGHWK